MSQFMSLKDHVYEYISKKIQEGLLKPNDKINEQDISDELNISRTPVREALIHLAADGLLISEPRRGFRVKPLIEKEAIDLYQLIGNLDAMAAVLAFDKISQAEINSMETKISEMDLYIEKKLFDEYYKKQVEFHNVYINICGNNELINTLNILKMRFLRQGYSNKNGESLQEIFKETNTQHKKILEFFKDNDPIGLEKYLKKVHWSIQYAGLDAL